MPGMQFKRDLVDTKNNVTDQLKGQKVYNVYDGGVITAYEGRDGRLFVVDGHHRRELAQRAERFVQPGANGEPVDAPRLLPVQVLKEADGWTPEMARAYGVRRNLIEGKGRAVDAADALVRAGGIERARGEVSQLPKSALTRDTGGLVELSPEGREQVLNRRVTEPVAAGIGKALPGDADRQTIALDQAAGRRDLSTYEDGLTLGREVATEDVVRSPDARQLSLDGMDVPQARSTAAERAVIRKDVLARAVAEQRSAKSGLGLELLPGETIDADARQRIATQIGENRGQVSEKIGAAMEYDPTVQHSIRESAKDLAEGAIGRQEAAARVYDTVIQSARRPIADIVAGKPLEEAPRLNFSTARPLGQMSREELAGVIDQVERQLTEGGADQQRIGMLNQDLRTLTAYRDKNFPEPTTPSAPNEQLSTTGEGAPVQNPSTIIRESIPAPLSERPVPPEQKTGTAPAPATTTTTGDAVGELEQSLIRARQRLTEARAAARETGRTTSQQVIDLEKQTKGLSMRLSAARKAAAEAEATRPAEPSPYAMDHPDEDTQTGTLFQRAARAKRDEVIEQLERTPLVSPRMVAEGLGDKPEYLEGLTHYIMDQRDKAVNGEMAPRDVAKAYAVTVASQGARAMSLERFAAKMRDAGIPLHDLPAEFRGRSANGMETVRPEDAMAAWFGTPMGQRALDALDRGEFDAEAWKEGAAVRKAFGDDWFGKTNVAGTPARGSVNLTNLHEAVDAINAAEGDPAKMRAAVSRLNGVGAAKEGFISHLLGFGEKPTVDARQVNTWLTGRGTTAGNDSEGAQAARLFRANRSDPMVSQYLTDRISAALDGLREERPEMAEVPKEAAGAVLHQWLWDSARQSGEPLHNHAGLYEAMRLYQKPNERYKMPKVGDTITDAAGRRYTIEAINEGQITRPQGAPDKPLTPRATQLPLDGTTEEPTAAPMPGQQPQAGQEPIRTARVRITDASGRHIATIPGAPLDQFAAEQKRLRGEALKQAGIELLNLPREMETIGDFGSVFREGGILTLSNPKLAAKATADMLRSISETGHEAFREQLMKLPDAAVGVDNGLYVTGGNGLHQREEAFIGRLLTKVPGLSAVRNLSERVYTSYLDSIRVNKYSLMAGQLRAQGLTPEKAPDEFRDIARWINMASGRGELPENMKDIAPVLNGLLFSPRLLVSRAQFLAGAATGFHGMAPAARKLAAKNTLSYALWVAGIAGLAKLGGAEVETNPASPDFLKLKWGNTRYDLGSGNTQVLRATFRLVNGFYRNATKQGNAHGQQPADVASAFVRSKLAPVPSFVADAATGKSFKGEPFDLPSDLAEHISPLFAKDLYEAWQEEGATGAVKAIPAAFGVGVQNYAEKARGGQGSGLFGSGSSKGSSLFQ